MNMHKLGESLVKQVETAVAFPMTYHRVGETPIPVKVRLGSGEGEMVIDRAQAIAFHSTTCIFAIEYLASWTPNYPLEGDYFVDGDGERWKVLTDGNDRSWTYHGADEQAFRVKVKNIG